MVTVYILRELGMPSNCDVIFNNLEELREYANELYFASDEYDTQQYFAESDFEDIRNYIEDTSSMALVQYEIAG